MPHEWFHCPNRRHGSPQLPSSYGCGCQLLLLRRGVMRNVKQRNGTTRNGQWNKYALLWVILVFCEMAAVATDAPTVDGGCHRFVPVSFGHRSNSMLPTSKTSPVMTMQVIWRIERNSATIVHSIETYIYEIPTNVPQLMVVMNSRWHLLKITQIARCRSPAVTS